MSAMVPLKHLAAINERVLDESTDPHYSFRYVDIGSVGNGDLMQAPSEVQFGVAPSRARRLVAGGDTIVSTVRTYLRAVWPVPDDAKDLVVSTGFAVISPKAVDSRYLSWWLRSDIFIDEVVARSVGVSYPAINPLELGRLSVRVPSEAEQRAIADFLDTETARIDALITKKRRMIDLLDERVMSASRAVIMGSTEPGPRRRTGVPWLPDAPASWAVPPVYARFDVLLGRMVNAQRTASGQMRPYLRNANVRWDSVDVSDVAVMDFPAAERLRYRLKPGDLMVCEGGAGVGRAAVWRSELNECYFQKSLHRVRARGPWPVEWLVEWARVCKAMGVFAGEGNLATIPHLTAEQLREHRIPMPPSADCARLLAQLKVGHEAILATRRPLAEQLERLAEYRQALITAAVTGELEVPGVSA